MTDALSLSQVYIPTGLSISSRAGPDVESVERRFVDIDEQAGLDADWRRPSSVLPGGPEDALAEYRKIAVVGDAGAGKTTMLRHLATRLAAGEVPALPSLPLVVDLHELGRSSLLGTVPVERLFATWIAEHVEEIIPSATDVEEWVESRLTSGEAVLLLDGLDEVAGALQDDDGPYRTVSHALAALPGTYPDLPALFTCRRAHIERFVSIPRGFQVLETCDFGWD